MRNGTATASSMIRPPIVGVPALPWCPAGPSSRICWPNSFMRRYSMNLGPRNMHSVSEAMPAMRISPSMASGPSARRARRAAAPARDPPGGRPHSLETGRARPLHEHAVALPRQLLEHRAGLLRTARRVALAAAEAARDRQRGLSDRDHHVDPEPVGELADLVVETLGFGPQLSHRAQHGETPFGGG